MSVLFSGDFHAGTDDQTVVYNEFGTSARNI